MESPAETTSPGIFVALASPSAAEESPQPWVPRGSLPFGAGVGLLIAIGIGTAYFASFRRQDIEWAKLAVHLLAYCVTSCAALGVMLERELGREGSNWAGSISRAARGGALAAAIPGALALGHFARLRMEFIGAAPLALAGLAAVGLFALRAACRPRGTRGYLRSLARAAGITVAGAGTLALMYIVLAALVEWPSEYEIARMLMVQDLRAANLLDAFYYAVGAIAGAAFGAAIGAFVGLWSLGRTPAAGAARAK